MQGVPFTRIKRFIESGAKYARARGRNFWEDLIVANKEREIKQMGNVYWYVPFAPMGFSEMRAIADKTNFLEFGEGHIRDVAVGLSNVLRYYGDHGFDSFNCVIYSGALGTSDSFRAGLSVVARPNIRPNYASIDTWFMPLLLEESVIPAKPEDLASEVSKYF
jgi:galactose-1-phosphate uridylyltransferase